MVKLYYTKKNKYTISTSYPIEGLGVIVNSSSIILENNLNGGEGFDNLVINFDELERGKLVFYDYMLSLKEKTHKIVKYLVEDVYDANYNLDSLIERMKAIGLEEDGFDISRKFLTIFIDSNGDIFVMLKPPTERLEIGDGVEGNEFIPPEDKIQYLPNRVMFSYLHDVREQYKEYDNAVTALETIVESIIINSANIIPTVVVDNKRNIASHRNELMKSQRNPNKLRYGIHLKS